MLNSFSQFLMSHKKFFLLAQDLKLLGDLSMGIQELVIVFGVGFAAAQPGIVWAALAAQGSGHRSKMPLCPTW